MHISDVLSTAWRAHQYRLWKWYRRAVATAYYLLLTAYYLLQAVKVAASHAYY